MARLQALDPTTTTGRTKQLLDSVKQKLGVVPNLMRTMANSEATLASYLAFSGALGGGALSPKLREQIAIAVAEANRCEYCLSAHTAIGKMVGLHEHELAASRQAKSQDAKDEAALQFAHDVVVRRGELDSADLARVKAAGWDDSEIAEMIANVALNILTNYFNHIAQTDIDFPKVKAGLAKTA